MVRVSRLDARALRPIVALASGPTFRPAREAHCRRRSMSSVPVGVAGFAMIACLALARARTADGTHACNCPQMRRFHGQNLRCCTAQPKGLDRSGDFAKSETARAPGGQSGVGPTKFSTEKFAGDRVRCGADRGDASPCAPRLWWISSRRDSCRRVYCNSNHRGGDGVLSAGLTATLRRDRVPSNGRRVR
jgi:hypothetical protein